MTPIEILKNNLLGESITFFSVSDSWTLYIGEFYLVAQNIISDDEKVIEKAINDSFELAKHTVDKEYISKSAIVSSNMRKEIIDIELDIKYNLTLKFELGSNLLIPTNEDIVDWQWCINKSGADPYSEKSLLTCFWEGEIEMNKE
ncbi:hypothetical protein [Nonlabens ulvanivorans]|uniref:hypothetical protein n=1 Tax=Nonlabens ulvanivorans TaxID=906888 RepID=UPI0029437282|nr:hypothetical protein [Nonlabens ulvanivorans]WOI23595.1 hypothetical protein R1T42_03880 [Nonlabens ulvanivorans]